MKIEEFRARFDELRRMRESLGKYVVLSDRLTEVVEAYLEAEQEVQGFRDRIPELVSEYKKSQPPVGDDYFYVAFRTPLSEVAAEIAAHNEEGYDLEDVPSVEEPATTKTGMPAVGADTRRQSTTGKSDSTRSQNGEPRKPAEDLDVGKPPAGVSNSTKGQDLEPEKPCRKCKAVKPLSGFPKNHACADGHTNECKECAAARHKQRREKKKAKKVTKLSQPKERLCTSGERCVKADPDDLVPTPAILDAINDHPSGLCRGCQKRAGVA